MALNTTTLSTAMTVSDTVVNLTATTGVNVPNYPVGPFTYIIVEQELMIVTQFSGTSGDPVQVSRGQNGTKCVAHAISAPAFIFLSTDNYTGVYGALQFSNPIQEVVGSPVTGATITPTVWGPGTLMHYTGTTNLATINLPAGVLATRVTLVFDGSAGGLTWVATGNISIGGTLAAAKSAVTFVYDVSTTKWIPSRVA